jgi:hypothetical protein
MSSLFHSERRSWWAVALTGSILSHVAGAAIGLDLLPRWTPDAPVAEIMVTSLVLPEDTPPSDTPTDTALTAPNAIQDEPEADSTESAVPPASVTEPPPAMASAPPAPLTAPPAVTDNPLITELGEASLPLPGADTAGSPAPLPAPPDIGRDVLPDADTEPGAPPLPDLPRLQPAPPPDAEALRDMVERIRAQLDQPCLIALPQIGADANRLLVLGDNDLAIRDVADRVLADPAPAVTLRPVLLDRRQCPAINFLRARGEYPAFGLTIGLVSNGILSGGRLIGRIEGIPEGAQTTLLLVDDNGVVQDLRRFLRFSGGLAEFDIPVTRDGAMRDTSQILIAAVTPSRLNSVTNLAGTLADTFFPAFSEELGDQGTLAVIPFDLR